MTPKEIMETPKSPADDWVIPNKRSMSLSASKIEEWYLCTTKFHANYIAKVIPFVETEHTKKGKILHKIMEDAINTNGLSLDGVVENVPPMYALNSLVEVLTAEGTKSAEIKFGINTKGQATVVAENWSKQPDGNPYLYIGSIDALVRNGKYSTVIDWKTGKVFNTRFSQKNNTMTEIQKLIADKKMQLAMYAWAEFLLNSECQYVKGIYVFTEHEEKISFIFERDKDFAKLNKTFMDTANFMWWVMGEWKELRSKPLAKTSALCGWCGYNTNCDNFKRKVS